MYGLEKEKQKKGFEYDLEQEITQKPTRAKEIIAKAKEKEQEIKNTLRAGAAKGAEFDQLGDILHAYSALERVINRINKS